MEQGRILEDGPPANLLARQDSRYRSLLEDDQTIQKSLWQGTQWRKWRIENGRLVTSLDQNPQDQSPHFDSISPGD